MRFTEELENLILRIGRLMFKTKSQDSQEILLDLHLHAMYLKDETNVLWARRVRQVSRD